ncbi:putative ubiquitin activating enzyme [Toxoplasma gondii RUB]|uniref:Putative ubiquitin activating enzyme n=3 Tax=Toxoplasma gondii TaxID=5811 RepID=A0A086LMJ0_TOXGO|nr:putative ubiquitin activating enzyme [Toxoplasma gondii GAB2-2007-GAL-DOM2]KFG57858.1 putative ubiquitin activating enzyme [Toxoplasma gondii RUB]
MAALPSSPAPAPEETVANSLLSHRVFDRQIRLWGVESQRRLLSSHVLLVGLTSIHVELAKNLALSGVRVSVCDSRLVGEVDFSFNFLVNRDAEGQRVATVSLAGLREMAPFVVFEEVAESEFQRLLASLREQDTGAKTQQSTGDQDAGHAVQFVQRFAAISVASEFYPLSSLAPLDALCRRLNVALCSCHCSGTLGFGFLDFHHHTFRVPAPKAQTSQAAGGKATATNGEEESRPHHVMREISFPSLDDMLHCSLGNADRKVDPAIFIYLTLEKWRADKDAKGENEQENGTLSRLLPLPRYDIHPEDEEFAEFAQQLLRHEGGPAAAACEQSPTLLKTLPMMWGCQYTVTAAVVGGILAQELRKYITKEQEPIPNCLVFNSETSTAAVASLPPPGVSVSALKTAV